MSGAETMKLGLGVVVSIAGILLACLGLYELVSSGSQQRAKAAQEDREIPILGRDELVPQMGLVMSEA
jgi:hypothetical protein